MRRTVSREMPSTSPSATRCRASSRQSHWQSERSPSSGRSHAALTTCRATSGGERAGVPAVAGRATRRRPGRRSVWPTCGRAARPSRPVRRCACTASPAPGAAWPALAGPIQRGSSAVVASPPGRHGWCHPSRPSTVTDARASLSPLTPPWPEYSKRTLLSAISYPISVELYLGIAQAIHGRSGPPGDRLSVPYPCLGER